MISHGKIRIVMAKLGVDAHDAGIRFVSAGLRDAGIEVVYLGPYQTVQKIINTAIQEDVDVIGLSTKGGLHLEQASKILEALKEIDTNIPVIMGGVMPRQDVAELEKLGIRKIFLTGDTISDMVSSIKKLIGNNGR